MRRLHWAGAPITAHPEAAGHVNWSRMTRPGSFLILGGFTLVGFTAVSELVLGRNTTLDVRSMLALAAGALLTLEGLSRLRAAGRHISAAHGEAVQLAVIQERMRFSRDLHDLLGHSLSAIMLEAELASKIAADQPSRTQDELRRLVDSARQALRDVRAVSHGYGPACLPDEVSLVTALLTSAGVNVHAEVNHGALSETVDSALAAVLREAVTNILRHSTAQHCSITTTRAADDTVRLRVANDGIPRGARLNHHGNGFRNMSARLREIGGELTVSLTRNGQHWFELTAAAPGTFGMRMPAGSTAAGSTAYQVSE